MKIFNPPLASIRQSFADTLCDLASQNPNLYVVDMDLRSSLKLSRFALRYKSRFIECGVAEANAAAVAAGLAKSGKTVFLTSFACFSPAINWAVIKQSICYNQLNVKIIGSHAGLLSTDLGATHQMLEDIALMRALPNMEVFAPLDAVETQKIITTVSHSPLPAYVRLVRPDTPTVYENKLPFSIGQSHVIKPGREITLLAYGPILAQTLVEIENNTFLSKTSLEIINCSSIKPLDSKTILNSVKKTGRVLVLEDHQKQGGFGEAVAALILESGLKTKFAHLAVNNQFGQSSKDYHQLYDFYHLAVSDIINTIKQLMVKTAK